MDNIKTTRLQTCRPSTRRLIQLYSALLHNAHLRGFIDGEIYQSKAKYACVPGLNCYSCPGAVGACPLGALQNALAASGHRAGWYILGILLLFGTVLGRTICGWLCPFGLVQELLHKIPTFKLKKNRTTRLLSYLKYVILAVFVIAIPLWYGLQHDMPLPGFCKYICPAGTLEGAMGLLSNPGNSDLFSMLGLFFTRKFVILIIIALACIFCYRSFCRFVCPLGAIYGLFNRFCLVGVKVDTDKCSSCGACVRACGMDVKRVGDHECIHCAKCMDVCAQKAISLKAGNLTLKAPEGTVREEEQKKRKSAGRIAWGVALAVLLAALLWFNFLDPAIRIKTAAPDAQSAAETSVGFEVGMQLKDFTIDCLDGSSFTLSETRGKVTFINLWATYCHPCVQELPYFDALYREHGDDIALLAVHSSIVTDDPAVWLADKNFSLPFAVDTEDDLVWNIVNGSSTLPQTIVLDRNGVVIYNQKGSVTPEVLAELYARADAAAPVSAVQAAVAETDEDAYLVLVTDEEGEPIPGVTVQFCTDTECVLGETDKTGIARFAYGDGDYTVHILRVPAGYAADDTEYSAPAQPGRMTIVLQSSDEAAEEDDAVVDVAEFGLHYERPAKYENLKGFLNMSGGYPGDGLLNFDLEYYAVSPERLDEYLEYCEAYIDAYENDEEAPEAPDPSWMSQREHAVLFTLFGINGGRGEEELRALLKECNAPYYDDFTWLEEAGTFGDTTFYFGQYERTESRMDEYREMMGDFFPEFEDLYRDKESFRTSLTLREPIWRGKLEIGDVLRFETTDLDGNPVSSEALFAESEVTMINLWGTWCGPCKKELPELAAMAKDFEAQGCQVIGICNDAYKDGIIDTAKSLLLNAGAEYLNLVGSPELDELLHATAFPTSFFVDSSGRLLLEPIVGADLEAYPLAVSQALSQAEHRIDTN